MKNVSEDLGYLLNTVFIGKVEVFQTEGVGLAMEINVRRVSEAYEMSLEDIAKEADPSGWRVSSKI